MHKILARSWEVTRKALYFALEYIRIGVQWKLKLLKSQVKKWKRCGAQKELDKAYGRLGAEIFALYKGGQNNWQNMPLVEQELSLVEAAESRLFTADEGIEEINSQYQRRKKEIKTKYRMKRSLSGGGEPE